MATKSDEAARNEVLEKVDALNEALKKAYTTGIAVRVGLAPNVNGGRMRNDQNLVYVDDPR